MLDSPFPVTWRLENELGEAVLAPGVRVTLTVSGSAVFTGSVTHGILLSGGGTNRVLVEFVDGLVVLDVLDTADVLQETVTFGGQDTEHLGVEVQSDIFENFEADAGGFTTPGPLGEWQWGQPIYGGVTAWSGRNVWATRLDGGYSADVNEWVNAPPYRLGTGSAARLEFWSWIDSEDCCDIGFVEVSADDASWTVLDTISGHRGWSLESYDLSAFAGQLIRVRLRFTSDDSLYYLGWYVEDFAVRGRQSLVTVLDGPTDHDADGLSSADEIAAGTDPLDSDTDNDGAGDAADNCPLAPARPSRTRKGCTG